MIKEILITEPGKEGTHEWLGVKIKVDDKAIFFYYQNLKGQLSSDFILEEPEIKKLIPIFTKFIFDKNYERRK